MTTDVEEICIFVICVIIFIGAVTYIDFIVHHTLYSYGLQFSFDWAVPYWIGVNVLFITGGVLAVSAYWLKREETLRHRMTAALIGASVYLMSLNLGILWFVLLGELPPLNEVWWWYPFHWLFGVEWTTMSQIIFTVSVDLVLISLWVVWYWTYR